MKALKEAPFPHSQIPHLDFTVYRIPFFLEPDYPVDEHFFESNRERLHRKWGGREQFAAQKRRHRLKERGIEAGLSSDAFNLDRTASSTVVSHRLVQWISHVYGFDASERFYDRLNQFHFTEGRKLNDRQALLGLAIDEGFDAAATEAFLSSNAGEAEVLRTFKAVQQLGIHGIPTFVIDGGREVLSGAVRAEELERVFRDIEAEAVIEKENQADQDRPPEQKLSPSPVFAHLLSMKGERKQQLVE